MLASEIKWCGTARRAAGVMLPEMQADPSFGSRLKEARKRRHLTQRQAGNVLGMTHSAIGQWETGLTLPALDRLIAAAELYKASLDWLVWGGDVGSGIENRIRDVPEILRAALVQRLHQEIDATLEAAKRLPAGRHDLRAGQGSRSAALPMVRGRQAPDASEGRNPMTDAVATFGLAVAVGLMIAYAFYRAIRNTVGGRGKVSQGAAWVCPSFGTRAEPATHTKGSTLLELFLWLCLIVPGLIYSIWRVTSRVKVCPTCKAQGMIPVNTPRGQELITKK